MNEAIKKQVLEVLEAHKLCVMSTVTPSGMPQAAIVGFSQNAELQLLIGTSNLTRKFANLQQTPNVAIAVGDFNSEVQYEGTVRVLSKEELAETSFAGLPGIAKYQEDETQTWLLISPAWIRLTTHGAEHTVAELVDFS
jgi:general stress protein 26